MENSWRAFLVFFLVGVVFGQTQTGNNNNVGPNGFNTTQPLTVSARAYHGGWYAIQNSDVETALRNFDPLDRYNNNSWEFDVYDATHRLTTTINPRTPLWYQTWDTLYCKANTANRPYDGTPISEPCANGACQPQYFRECNIPPRETVLDSEHLIIVPTLGSESNFGTKITNLTICPRFDVDWFEVHYGRSKPAIYTTEIFSKQSAKDAPGSKQGIIPIQFDQNTVSRINGNAPAHPSALWMETIYKGVNVTKYRGITGGKDKNVNYYYVTGRNQWVPDPSLQKKSRDDKILTNDYYRGDSFYKGQYSIHVKEETKCPTQHSAFSTSMQNPKNLNTNGTFLAYGFLCNGAGYTDTVRAHYWRYRFNSGSLNTNQASTPRQIFIVRANTLFSLPVKDNFQASLYFGRSNIAYANNQLLSKYGCTDNAVGGNPYRCNYTLNSLFFSQDLSTNTGSSTNDGRGTPNQDLTYDFWIQMNWTHNGRSQATDLNTQGSRLANDTYAPPGYLGYRVWFERCPRDWMEPGSGAIFNEGGNTVADQTTFEAFTKRDTNLYIRSDAAGNTPALKEFTVPDLTICPLYGPGANVVNSTAAGDQVAFSNLRTVLGDPDNYEVDVRDTYPGYLTATLTVTKGGFCLQPDWAQDVGTHTQDGYTDFKELQTPPSNSGGQWTSKATVIAGWGQKYSLRVYFCGGFPTDNMKQEPDNEYDWFRNYTEYDILQYSINIAMKQECPYAGQTRSNIARTSARDIGFVPGVFKINPTYADDAPQWLCRPALTGETGNPYSTNLAEAWYSINTLQNYTYINVTLSPVWWSGSNNNGARGWAGTGWPQYKMSLFADCNTTGCPNNQAPILIQTQSNYNTFSMGLFPWNGGLDRSQSTTATKFFIKVEMDWPAGKTPRLFPFLNFKLTVNALDCLRDVAEGARNVGQQQLTNDIFTRAFDLTNDLGNRRVSPSAPYSNNTFTICGYMAGDAQMAVSRNNIDPSEDFDYYKFTITGSQANNVDPVPGLLNISLVQIDGQYSHWNQTDRRADLRLDVYTDSEQKQVIPGSNTIGTIGFDLPFGYDTPVSPTSSNNANKTRISNYYWGLYKAFVPESNGPTTYNFKVWSENRYNQYVPNYPWPSGPNRHRGYGKYEVKITYTQDCPRAFTLNNSRIQSNNGLPEPGTSVVAQQSGTSGRWSISADVAPKSSDQNIVRTGASWIGAEHVPWNCLNPQTFKVTASRNATRLKIYYYRKFKYTNTPQLTLTVYRGVDSFQYTDQNPANNYPKNLDDTPNSLTLVVDLQLLFAGGTSSTDFFIIINKPTGKDWTAYDLQTEMCQQDRYDWNFTLIRGQLPYGDTSRTTNTSAHPIHVWALDCSAVECGGSAYPFPLTLPTGIYRSKRINTTSTKAFVNNMNLCFTDDDRDEYELLIDDWTTDLIPRALNTPAALPGATIRPQGFLRTWVYSKKLPVTVSYPNYANNEINWNDQDSIEEHPLRQAPQHGTNDGGENWLTSSWTVIDQATVDTSAALSHRRHKKVVQVSGNNFGPNSGRYVQTDYNIEWKYQYRCPIASDWGEARETNKYGETRNLGENNALEGAYRIPTPKCSDENYIWTSGYQFLCSDQNPYVGAQAHYYYVKNLVPGLMKTSIWVNSSHFSTGTGNIKHSFDESDVTFNCGGTEAQKNLQYAPIRLTVWKNSGLNSLTGKADTLYLNGCSNYNNTLDLVLGMGTHIIKVERLLDNVPANFFRDYHFSIKMEYCGCPTLAQTGDKHVNIQFTRIAGHNGTLTKNEIDDFVVQLEKYLGLPTGTVFFFREPSANGTGTGVFEGSIGFEGITEADRTAAIDKLKNTPQNVTELRTPIGGFHVTAATTVAPPPAPSPAIFTPIPTTSTPAPTNNNKCYSRETVIWLGVWLGLFGVAFLVTLGIVIALSSGAAGGGGGNDSYHLHPR